MAHSDREQGSAHVVLIILLIMVILGGLGTAAYFAFTKQKNTQAATQSNTQTSNQSQSASTSTSTQSGTRELVFANWDVAVNVPKSSNLYATQVIAEDGTTGYDGYYVGDTDFDRVCNGFSDNTSIGSLTRAKADANVDTYLSDEPMTNRQYFTKYPTGAVLYEDYVYYYTKPNGGYECTDPSRSGGDVASNALGDGRTGFINALASLHTTNK